MAHHIRQTCAHCRRSLSVPAAYLGQWVICNHCDHCFLATLTPVRCATGFDPDAAVEVEMKMEGAAGALPREAFRTLRYVASATCELSADASPATDLVAAGEVNLLALEGLEEKLAEAEEGNRQLADTRVRLEDELARRARELERLILTVRDLLAVAAGRDRAEAERDTAGAHARQIETRLDDLRRLCDEIAAGSESGRLDLFRQHELAAERWQAERRELVARWEHELQDAREEAARALAEQQAAARAAQEQALQQLVTARLQFERERSSLQAKIDALTSERDAANELATHLRLEHQGCLERESQWEGTLGEYECRHRSEIETLAHELRTARQQATLATQRERELGERLEAAELRLEAALKQREAPAPAPDTACSAVVLFDPEPEQAPGRDPVDDDDHDGRGPGGADPSPVDAESAREAPPPGPGQECDAAPEPAPVDQEGPGLDPWFPKAEPLPEESPEVRILSLRNSLRAHEAENRGRLLGPLSRRLIRLWKKGDGSR